MHIPERSAVCNENETSKAGAVDMGRRDPAQGSGGTQPGGSFWGVCIDMCLSGNLTNTSKHLVASHKQGSAMRYKQPVSPGVPVLFVTPGSPRGARHLVHVGPRMVATAKGPAPSLLLCCCAALRKEMMTNPKGSAILKIKGCSLQLAREIMS